jgi:hypothetical protein
MMCANGSKALSEASGSATNFGIRKGLDQLAATRHSLEYPLTYKLYLPPSVKIMLSVMVVAFASVGISLVFLPALFRNWTGPPWFVGLFFLAILGGNAIWVLRLPHKIMFHQDGTIELISVLTRRSVLARDVVSIKPEGTTSGFMVVRTARSKFRLYAQFDGFHDFLTRLKAVNPTVELRGC